jgi:hypothetical protein
MHKPVRCMHQPVTSKADACTYIMGSVVLISSRICLIPSYFGSFIEGSHTTKNMASGLILSNAMSHNIRLTTLSSEREEERRRLEEKLRQLEDDLGDSTSAASLSQPLMRALTFSASSTPTQSPAKACRRKQEAQAEDEDENLLHEVDEEMKRGQSIDILFKYSVHRHLI